MMDGVFLQGEVYKGFSHAFWAFNKGSMSQTISIMESETEEVQALEVFNLILTYAGLAAQQSNCKEESNQTPDESPAGTGGNKDTDENDHVFLIQVNSLSWKLIALVSSSHSVPVYDQAKRKSFGKLTK